jgi:hypothetical protein
MLLSKLKDNIMKKINSIVIGAFFALLVIGCGGSGGDLNYDVAYIKNGTLAAQIHSTKEADSSIGEGNYSKDEVGIEKLKYDRNRMNELSDMQDKALALFQAQGDYEGKKNFNSFLQFGDSYSEKPFDIIEAILVKLWFDEKTIQVNVYQSSRNPKEENGKFSDNFSFNNDNEINNYFTGWYTDTDTNTNVVKISQKQGDDILSSSYANSTDAFVVIESNFFITSKNGTIGKYKYKMKKQKDIVEFSVAFERRNFSTPTKNGIEFIAQGILKGDKIKIKYNICDYDIGSDCDINGGTEATYAFEADDDLFGIKQTSNTATLSDTFSLGAISLKSLTKDSSTFSLSWE